MSNENVPKPELFQVFRSDQVFFQSFEAFKPTHLYIYDQKPGMAPVNKVKALMVDKILLPFNPEGYQTFWKIGEEAKHDQEKLIEAKNDVIELQKIPLPSLGANGKD